MIEDGTLDPIFATIVRLAIDGMWLAEKFNLHAFRSEYESGGGRAADRLDQAAADAGSQKRRRARHLNPIEGERP